MSGLLGLSTLPLNPGFLYCPGPIFYSFLPGAANVAAVSKLTAYVSAEAYTELKEPIISVNRSQEWWLTL